MAAKFNERDFWNLDLSNSDLSDESYEQSQINGSPLPVTNPADVNLTFSPSSTAGNVNTTMYGFSISPITNTQAFSFATDNLTTAPSFIVESRNTTEDQTPNTTSSRQARRRIRPNNPSRFSFSPEKNDSSSNTVQIDNQASPIQSKTTTDNTAKNTSFLAFSQPTSSTEIESNLNSKATTLSFLNKPMFSFEGAASSKKLPVFGETLSSNSPTFREIATNSQLPTFGAKNNKLPAFGEIPNDKADLQNHLLTEKTAKSKATGFSFGVSETTAPTFSFAIPRTNSSTFPHIEITKSSVTTQSSEMFKNTGIFTFGAKTTGNSNLFDSSVGNTIFAFSKPTTTNTTKTSLSNGNMFSFGQGATSSSLMKNEVPKGSKDKSSLIDSTQKLSLNSFGKDSYWTSKGTMSDFFNPNTKKADNPESIKSNNNTKFASVKPKTTQSNTNKTSSPSARRKTTDKQLVMEETSPPPPQQSSTTGDNHKDMTSLADGLSQLKTLLYELDGVKSLNDMRAVSMMIGSLEKTVQSVRETFKCDICFMPQYNYFYFCPECGRLVGCYLCAYRLDRCPTCRKRLPSHTHRVPHIIPGLASSLDENEITREELRKQLDKFKF